jgi:hypothetical protein
MSSFMSGPYSLSAANAGNTLSFYASLTVTTAGPGASFTGDLIVGDPPAASPALFSQAAAGLAHTSAATARPTVDAHRLAGLDLASPRGGACA